MDQETVFRLAHLSRIELPPSSVQSLSRYLAQMEKYLEPLCALDLSAAEPMITAVRHGRSGREDRIVTALDRSRRFLNAPEVEFDHFVIPKVMP